jgi:hypothetical protein
MSRLKRILSPESRDHQELTVALAPGQALEACRAAAVEDLGWAAKPGGDEGRLTILEDFTRLNCGDAPIRMEVEVRPENGGERSTVNLEAIVPGVGGVTNKHLTEGVMVFSLYLARRAKSLGG